MKKNLIVALVSVLLSSLAMAATVRVAVEATDVKAPFFKELFKSISRKTGDTYQLVNVPAGAALQTLMIGTADFASVVPSDIVKEAELIYSFPFLATKKSLLMAKKVASVTLEPNAKVLCVRTKREAEKAIALSRDMPIFVATEEEKFAMLESGRCSGLITDKVNSEAFMKGNPDRVNLYKEDDGALNVIDKYAFATTSRNQEILDRFNKALQAMKSAGSLDALRYRLGLQTEKIQEKLLSTKKRLSMKEEKTLKGAVTKSRTRYDIPTVAPMVGDALYESPLKR